MLEERFASLINELTIPQSAEDFIPPPRYAATTFETYHIDNQVEGQAEAVAAVQAFACGTPKKFWQLHRRSEQPGMYLDGDFGVGKTHLLAASFHAARGTKRYLSFSDAISIMILSGPKAAADLLAADLICIDEFELDDPSNTRLIDLLLDDLTTRGCRIMVTSNTVPDDLGGGRFPVEDFRRQLIRISSIFSDIHVPGHDYRQNLRTAAGHDPVRWSESLDVCENNERSLCLSADQMDALLADIPVVNIRRIAASLDTLSLSAVYPCNDQFVALRLVHLIDKLYDFRVRMFVEAHCHMDDLFLDEYKNGSFAKKYRRCASRLAELCSESD